MTRNSSYNFCKSVVEKFVFLASVMICGDIGFLSFHFFLSEEEEVIFFFSISYFPYYFSFKYLYIYIHKQRIIKCNNLYNDIKYYLYIYI